MLTGCKSTWIFLWVLLLYASGQAAVAHDASRGWRVHDMDRPKPRRVVPGPQALPAPVPSDAVVLFDGGGLSEWTTPAGGAPPWEVEAGVLVVVPVAGRLATKRAFGDAQIHLEWAAPVPATGRGQGRGNSGIHVMGLYEVQILDCHDNVTYADGYAGAVYGQHPPLVNACRPPGEWQSLDIVFRRPRFDGRGRLVRPARVTVHLNGILVQDNSEVIGPTLWLHHLPYRAHADRLPFTLQEHGNPVRFRNIWVRDLEVQPSAAGAAVERVPGRGSRAVADRSAARRIAGRYVSGEGAAALRFTISVAARGLEAAIPERGQRFRLLAFSESEFELEGTDARLRFLSASGGPGDQFQLVVAGDVSMTFRREQPSRE